VQGPQNVFSYSDAGYQITEIGGGGGFTYSAWAPTKEAKKVIQARMKERYEIGEKIPGTERFIGCFKSPEEAAKACEIHYGENNGD
jgi:hypothetical protein